MTDVAAPFLIDTFGMSRHVFTHNEYEVVRNELLEPNLLEVRGAEFCIEDLYAFVGRPEHVCRFVFREETDAHKTYGASLTGLVVYSPTQKAALERSEARANIEDAGLVRIRCVDPELPRHLLDDLKYGGISILDIEEISYIPFASRAKINEDGTKEVPGIVYLDIDDTRDIDVDKLFQNLVNLKNNGGTEPIPYEKEKFIGITLGQNNGRIDSRILTQFGFDVASASANTEVGYHALMTKKRHRTISEVELDSLRELEAIRWMKRASLLLKEIERSGVRVTELKDDQARLGVIQKSVEKFEPHVLLHGKKQIYWELAGYLHIALRHVREMQVGLFKGKTPFPYGATDLEILVERVLAQVAEEIRTHYEKARPRSAFSRHGKMSIYFNGDFFSLKIDEGGRLVSFYVTEPKSV
jgi:hypothetical protein